MEALFLHIFYLFIIINWSMSGKNPGHSKFLHGGSNGKMLLPVAVWIKFFSGGDNFEFNFPCGNRCWFNHDQGCCSRQGTADGLQEVCQAFF